MWMKFSKIFFCIGSVCVLSGLSALQTVYEKVYPLGNEQLKTYPNENLKSKSIVELTGDIKHNLKFFILIFLMF